MRLIRVLLVLILVILNLYSYENKEGKIDMHGGKGDSLLSNKGFSNNFKSLGTMEKKEEKTKNKNFIEVKKIEKIDSLKENNE